MDYLPRRRDRGLTTEDFHRELIVYDLDRHHAHCLNATAMRIWQLCDGTRTIDAIAEQVGSEQGSGADAALVWRALEEFDKASLLDAPLPAGQQNHSRREAVMALGWIAGLPLVLSVAVPQPAAGQTPGPGPTPTPVPTGATGPTGSIGETGPTGPTGAAG